MLLAIIALIFTFIVFIRSNRNRDAVRIAKSRVENFEERLKRMENYIRKLERENRSLLQKGELPNERIQTHTDSEQLSPLKDESQEPVDEPLDQPIQQPEENQEHEDVPESLQHLLDKPERKQRIFEEEEEEQQKQKEIPVRDRIIKTKKPAKPVGPSRWDVLSEKFAENWTGIVGAILLVMGVGFLGVYSALQVEPFYRFWIMVGFAAVVGGGSEYLRRQEKWKNLGHWLRSSASTIFLLACLGAGRIPGLQWIESPMYALILLQVGVGLNLVIGYLARTWSFASLHVVLAVIAVAIMPVSVTTLMIVLLVSLLGIAICYQEKWDIHLVVSVGMFALYHQFWLFELDGLTRFQNIAGIVSLALVGLAAMMVHYRIAYRSEKRHDYGAYIAHAVNWVFLAMNASGHSLTGHWTPLWIVGAGLLLMLLAHRAKALKIDWLFNMDTVVAQIVISIGILFMLRWDWRVSATLSLLFVEMIAVALLMYYQRARFSYRFLMFVMPMVVLASVLYVFAMYFEEDGLVVMDVGFMGAILVTGIGFHLYSLQQRTTAFDTLDHILGTSLSKHSNFSLVAFLLCLMPVGLYAYLVEYQWAAWALMGMMLLFLFLRQRFQSDGMWVGTALSIMLMLGLQWARLYEFQEEWGLGQKLLYVVPFTGMIIGAIVWAYHKASEKYIRSIGVYVLGLQLGLIAYLMFMKASPIIPGVIWLLLSVVMAEAAVSIRSYVGEKIQTHGSVDRYLLHLGYAFLFAFLLRHFLVHLQLENHLTGIPVRLLLEGLALGGFVYWAALKAPKEKPIYRSWKLVHPLFLELILGFGIFTIALEAPTAWLPLAWIVMASLCLLIGQKRWERLRLYALLLSIATAFQVAFVSTAYTSPDPSWYRQAWIMALVAIFLNGIFLYAFFLYGKLKDVPFPPALGVVKRIGNAIQNTRNYWLIYPTAIGVAIFLYGSFDSSILTFLWVAECFVIFVLSIILRENLFRLTAMVGIVLSLIRLILFDLAQKGLLTRALVFLGVGVLLLVMNFLYSKYKGGENEERKVKSEE